ncbi:mechanosensitive ion channel family protein [Candidatus Poribacteria bacterium]|nr:MAG: mechanosensitive ion channel family protein [Candidatus Poribacteria bacterium]
MFKRMIEILNFRLFTVKDISITPFLIIELAALLIGGWIASKQIQKLLRKHALEKTGLDEGTQFTILKMIHYLIMAILIYQAISMIGLDLKGLAFIAGVMSLGIGFGLQNIASNFASGLIMMFERPVRVGDVVKVGDMEGIVTDIRMRSTTITTFDNVAVIIPNSEFITNRVVNWTHSDPKVRVHIPVGVAYGSDVELVTKLLLKIADEHPDVLDEPKPQVFFLGFGDSSLDFELAVWIPSPAIRKKVISDLNYSIEAAFREHDIEIPFPKRDVYIKAMPGVGVKV